MRGALHLADLRRPDLEHLDVIRQRDDRALARWVALPKHEARIRVRVVS
jgi:hypothetical protein